MKKEISVLVLAFILLISNVSVYNLSYAGAEVEASGEEIVTISGTLNVRELVYLDGSFSYDYLVMTDDETEKARYLLEFDNDEKLASDLLDFSGSKVVVEGFLQAEGSGQISAAVSEDNTQLEEKMRVRSIDILEEKRSSGTEDATVRVGSLIYRQSLLRTFDQVVVPARYADVDTKPHWKEYYEGQFYTDDRFSLAAYWRDASYGSLAIQGNVTYWVDLPQTEDAYLTYGGRDNDLIAAADSQIDFDGPDNGIQNISPDVLGSPGSDDVDSVIAIYNGLIGYNVAGYGYLEPIQLTTDEGTLYVNFIAIRDEGLGSPVGVPSDYFVGLAAHEMGHNFGWQHTATPTCVYCDPWSIMSGGIYGDSGPSGPIATQKDSEGWIEPQDIITVIEGQEQAAEFTLDMLGNATGENYLMAKVPFGSDGHYYSIEARKNVVNDHTPLEQTGLVVYHYSPTGHPESMEPRAAEMIVDTTGIDDLANADIDLGASFVDLKNNITITNVAQSNDTITVRVELGNVQPDEQNADCSGLVATIVGTGVSDVLQGTSGDDVINGMDGDDIIDGLGGNDVICGGDGDDVIDGGDGDDLLRGKLGNDMMLGGAGNDNMIGGRGDDRLEGGIGDDTLSGWSGNDELLGGDGNDSLHGGDGDDYLLGGDGNDKLRGWLGNDTNGDDNDET